MLSVLLIGPVSEGSPQLDLPIALLFKAPRGNNHAMRWRKAHDALVERLLKRKQWTREVFADEGLVGLA